MKIKEDGQILLLVFIALGIVLFTVLFVIGGSQVYFQNSQYSYEAESANYIAEAGIDKALASLNKTGGSYNGETETFIGGGSYSSEIINKDSENKILKVTGYVPNKANSKAKRTISMVVAKGTGIAFNYGLQTGEGGFCMGNGALLNGSIYSNGKIYTGNNAKITGDVYVAGGVQQSPNQQNECSSTNCQDYIFGKSISGESRQDVAQSFKPSTTNILTKLSLKLKKSGSPANQTVRIMSDDNGKPDKNNVLATGTLYSDLVSTQYGFVDIVLDSTPSLNADATYWIMIHTNSLDNTNYWYWSEDSSQGYTRGLSKWSSNWQSGNPTWIQIAGDLDFKIFLGGLATSISLSNGTSIDGNVHANTISGISSTSISKDAYYQAITDTQVSGGSCPNQHCHPGSEDPSPTIFPISDNYISDWKNQAVNAGVTSGDVVNNNNCNINLGPGKISGNIQLGNGCTITIKSPLWVTGSIAGGNSTIFILDQSFGGTSGLIIVDGKTTLGNGSDLKGTGVSGSYLMLVSNFDSTQSGSKACSDGTFDGSMAVDIGNSTISGILYSPKGAINFSTGASFKEIYAWNITLGNNSTLNYDTGFSSTVFSSGPSGSYSLVKGTYQVR